MKVIRGLKNVQSSFTRPAVTLGNFDGVHLGHQRIFRRVKEWARSHRGESIVYTFEPHPLKVLAPERAPGIITEFNTKVALIAEFGLDFVISEPFTIEFSRMSPNQFVEQIIHKGLGANAVFVGHNYRFGSGRGGSTATLQALGTEMGFSVEVTEAVTVGGSVVSSSAIRGLLARGEIRSVQALLGRPFSIRGTVFRGEDRGRGLGFPTANLATSQDLLPAAGVYAARVRWHDRILDGAVNIGTNPTFEGTKLTVEAHLLDFEGDLYGEQISVEFVERIREERTFSSPGALAAQIRQDVETIRNLLASEKR